MRAYVSKRTWNWKRYFPMLKFVYNSPKHIATGCSPLMLVHGYQPKFPVLVELKGIHLDVAKDFLLDMQEMLVTAWESNKTAHKQCSPRKLSEGMLIYRTEFYADRQRSPRNLSKGMLV